MDSLRSSNLQNPNSKLHITNHSRSFKKQLRKLQKEQKRQKKLQERLEDDLHRLLLDKPTPKLHSPLPEPDIRWTLLSDPDPKPESTGWSGGWEPIRKHDAVPLLHKDELSRLDMQGKCLMKCKEFFSTDEFDEEEEDEKWSRVFGRNEDLGLLYDKSLDFFRGLFEKEENLRGYYQKNREKGVFVCFVCEGLREKMGKKYMDCAGLVQHANSVRKTKRVCAHRAFGRIVCDVLSWDANKFSEKEVIDEVELHGVNYNMGSGKEDLMDYYIVGGSLVEALVFLLVVDVVAKWPSSSLTMMESFDQDSE